MKIYKTHGIWMGLALLIAFLGVINSANAQTSTVSGTITDASDGSPLPGATIIEKGTMNGTVSDMSGTYSLTVPDDAVLVFTFVGFAAQEIPVNNQTEINIALTTDFEELGEVVVIGYGETTAKELTGAVSRIKSDAIVQRQVPRVDQALQGQLSGVNITTNSGAPGGTANIRIRGLSTNGDNNPLILVDGVVYDAAGLNALNPSDIESINVLKDATAGIYGVRAANGVVLIETKKGSKNTRPTLEMSGYYGIQQTARKLDLLNAREYAILKNEAFAAGGQTPPFANTALGNGTDWQDEVFGTAPIQNYNLTVTGGSEKTTYNVGGSYFKQEGIVGGSKAQFERYNGRVNFITELAPNVKLTHVTLFTHEESSGLPQNGIGSVLYNAINAYPTASVRENDRYSYLENVSDIINPIPQMENSYNWSIANKITGKEEIEYTINDDFKVSGRAGYNYAIVDDKTFSPLVWYGDSKAPNTAANEDLDPRTVMIGNTVIERGASVYESRATYLDYNLEAFLNYNHTFNAIHTVKGTAGVSYLGNSSSGLNGTGFNIPNNSLELADISANQATGGYLNNVGSFQVKSRLASIFLRAEYDYQKRYLISAIIRRDGSTRFGENNRFGYFPSISGAWIFSDESFFTMPAFISFAKLRASYGISGNDRIGDFRYRASLGGEGNYVFNDAIVIGSAIGAAGNPDLKWETTEQTNIGLDLTLFNNIDLTANYFIKNTKDLLFQPAVSAILGTYGAGSSPPVVNGGDVRNSGLELDLGYETVSSNGLSFGATYNVTFIKNEVLRVPEGFAFIPGAAFSVGGNTATRFQAGFPIGYFIGYETDGIFQNQQEIAESSVTQAGAQPGDLRFVDQNGDGVISFGDNTDKTMIGSPVPDFTMGLNLNVGYKGIDLSANIYAAVGQEIIRNYERQQPYANQLAYNIARWTGEGSTNEYPRLTTGATQNTTFSDFYVEDGSYVRLKNVQLGYTLPASLTEKIGIRSLRLYVTANNLITLTRYLGYDPDLGSGDPLSAGVDNGFYPQARMYMGGLNIKF